MDSAVHRAVLLREVLELLDVQPDWTVVDCTVGVGGHSRAILDRLGEQGRLIGLDQDPTMLELAGPRLHDTRVILQHANFEDLPDVLRRLGIGAVDAVLADLGFCSDQLANPQRGLSFQRDGPLDMRLDPTSGEPASQLVRRLRERELADLFWQLGEERHSRRVAKKIVDTRSTTPIETTAQLADLVRSCVPRSKGHGIDPATRVFQALRIAVNDELGVLERWLQVLPGCLKGEGRGVVISFHSLEDRLVKRAFHNAELWTPIVRKAIQATEEEANSNPRARSAKLRGARKVGKH